MSRFGKRPLIGFALACAVTGVGVLGGCSAAEPGTASPSPNVTAPPDPLGGLQACAVLDKALAGQGFGPGRIDKAGGDNGCGAEKPQFASVGLVLDDQQGVDQVHADPSKIHEGEVNNRPARLVREGLGGEGDCAIALEVSPTARAYANVKLSTGSTDEACEFIQTVAEGIEPQLPKGK